MMMISDVLTVIVAGWLHVGITYDKGLRLDRGMAGWRSFWGKGPG